MDGTNILDKAAVVGAGLMGTQIGVVLSTGTRVVFLMSRHKRTLQRAKHDARSYIKQLNQQAVLRGVNPETVLGRIKITQRLSEALTGAELVVESIPESLPEKQALF